MNSPLASLVTSLADDELVIGHRHSEWTGFAPHLEEDVAFSSIAQDEIGHAAVLYELVAPREGTTADDLAFGRSPDEYRHAQLCERPNRDWAYTIARHWLYDHADEVRLRCLESSESEELAALARKMRREERYHVLHADAWMTRVAHGPVEGRSKLVDALADAFDDASGLFEPFDGEDVLVAEGLLPEPTKVLGERFRAATAAALDALDLPVRAPGATDAAAEFVASSSGDLIARAPSEAPETAARRRGSGGRAGRHSEDFDRLWSDLTATHRASPGATW